MNNKPEPKLDGGEPKQAEPRKKTPWYRKPDFMLGMVIGALLWLLACWFTNNPESPGYWRSFP